MILQQDVALLGAAETGVALELASLNQLAEFGRVAFVFKDFAAVEPMLDMVAL